MEPWQLSNSLLSVHREESGLNNSQVHIGPADPSSLFLEDKDQNNGKRKRTGQVLGRTVYIPGPMDWLQLIAL